MPARINRIIQELKKDNLDALLVSHQPNISYLTNYHSRDSYLLLSKKQKTFITDFRYLQEARDVLSGFSIQETGGSVFKVIASLIKKYDLKRVGFESRQLPYAEYEKISEYLPYKNALVAAINKVEDLRLVKDKTELAKIRRATEIAGFALAFARDILKPGKRENEVATEIEYFIKRDFGCDISFDIIVGFGPNSSYPHHINTGRQLKENEPVLIDLGVDFQGYKSDLTRVFFLGKIPVTARKIYNIVLAAQDKAIMAIKPGVRICDVDKIARQYIKDKGYGECFGHSLGHGIGLEVHESPHIDFQNQRKLESGEVFTVEPAIYLEHKFGIRIEDIITVTDKGCEVISGNINKSI